MILWVKQKKQTMTLTYISLFLLVVAKKHLKFRMLLNFLSAIYNGEISLKKQNLSKEKQKKKKKSYNLGMNQKIKKKRYRWGIDACKGSVKMWK